jgi:Uracil DNA glycosylase superfamily
MKILFLGPCRKHDRQTRTPFPPFSPKTPSGRYVALLKEALKELNRRYRFFMSNVVDESHFERGIEKNPSADQLIMSWESFERRMRKMNPDYVVAFGSNVRSAFSKNDRVAYSDGRLYCRRDHKVLFSPHPSFVMIYRRKMLQKYVTQIASLIHEDSLQRAAQRAS